MLIFDIKGVPESIDRVVHGSGRLIIDQSLDQPTVTKMENQVVCVCDETKLQQRKEKKKDHQSFNPGYNMILYPMDRLSRPYPSEEQNPHLFPSKPKNK